MLQGVFIKPLSRFGSLDIPAPEYLVGLVMIIIAASGSVSLILFGLAVFLIIHASTVRPSQVRTADHRSPEGYAFHQHRAMIRRQGWFCALAGVMTLGICATMGIVELTYNAE